MNIENIKSERKEYEYLVKEVSEECISLFELFKSEEYYKYNKSNEYSEVIVENKKESLQKRRKKLLTIYEKASKEIEDIEERFYGRLKKIKNNSTLEKVVKLVNKTEEIIYNIELGNLEIEEVKTVLEPLSYNFICTYRNKAKYYSKLYGYYLNRLVRYNIKYGKGIRKNKEFCYIYDNNLRILENIIYIDVANEVKIKELPENLTKLNSKLEKAGLTSYYFINKYLVDCPVVSIEKESIFYYLTYLGVVEVFDNLVETGKVNKGSLFDNKFRGYLEKYYEIEIKDEIVDITTLLKF